MGEEARSLRGGLAGHRMQLVGGRRALARSVAAEQAVLKMRRPRLGFGHCLDVDRRRRLVSAASPSGAPP